MTEFQLALAAAGTQRRCCLAEVSGLQNAVLTHCSPPRQNRSDKTVLRSCSNDRDAVSLYRRTDTRTVAVIDRRHVHTATACCKRPSIRILSAKNRRDTITTCWVGSGDLPMTSTVQRFNTVGRMGYLSAYTLALLLPRQPAIGSDCRRISSFLSFECAHGARMRMAVCTRASRPRSAAPHR